MDESVQKIKESIIEGRHKEIESLVREICKTGIALDTVIQEGLIAAMDVVGQRFSAGEIFVPEMLVSAMTMKLGLNIVKPLLTGEAGAPQGTVLIGTVKGDLHDIGKNIVVMMLEGAGFQVIDLGVDIDVEKVAAKVIEIRPQVLGLSALLTTTMPEMKGVIEELRACGLRDRVKIMVGGAPVDAAFAEKIGADGYGKDAVQAVALAHSFVGH
ncbi:MAG: cobalamin-binding protein [Deltaproteobacteria bacterium]|nr:MAG: cobalamin-binding protein [Deltaproteobacteria bacterium]